MSLFLATLLVGAFFLLVGGALAADTTLVRSGLKSFPRSERAALVLFGAAAFWFCHRVLHMSDADLIFPAPKAYYAGAFGLIALLSFFYVKEFLAVRGLAALALLAAGPLLDAAFGLYEIPSRLFMVSAVYVVIAAALVVAAQPWRLRDAIEWLQRVPGRARIAGCALAAYGLLLVGVAFVY